LRSGGFVGKGTYYKTAEWGKHKKTHPRSTRR